MHPTKAKVLASIEESSEIIDRALRRNFGVLVAPKHHSWTRLGVALGTLPLYAVSAVFGDLCYVMIARTADEGWDRIRPRDSRGD
jgi:hypothetical protein